MKTYLIEEYSPELEIEKNSIIIALTPKVSHDLDNQGIKYSIIEDYYDEVELTKGEDEYFKSQLQWIGKLDEFLQNNITELKKFDLKMGAIYFLFLKTMIDPLVIRCYMLNEFVKKIKPSNIIFVSNRPKDVSLDFKLRDEGKSYYSQIIPILCKEKNISLNYVYVTKDEKKARDENKNLKQEIREVLAKSKIGRDTYFFLKYGRKCFFTNKKDKLNILLLKIDRNGLEIIKTGLKNGHNIYLLSDNKIMKYSLFGSRKYLDININEKVVDNSKWEDTANQLENDELIKWVNEKCQLDVSDIILPRLKYFILNVCPEILRYFKFFIDFYEKEKIDFIITPHEWLPVEFAAIAAANYCKNTKSVNICHGDSAFANKIWNITELAHFNIFIASNNEFKKYFEGQCKTSQIQTHCYCSSHRLLNVKKIKNLRNGGKNILNSETKERIIYLPTMFTGDCRRMDSIYYPDAWYYKFQKSLIEYFSTNKKYTFVWKGLPASDRIYNPIPDFIKDNDFDNIEISTIPFSKYRNKHGKLIDRVICDYPSTGFYEAVWTGIPTMSLYRSDCIRIRETAKSLFGQMLQPFSSISEAIDRIEFFLNSEPDLFLKDIPTEHVSVMEILENSDILSAMSGGAS